jgi:hypothetical protein
MSYEGTTGKAGTFKCCEHCQHPKQLPALLHEEPCPRFHVIEHKSLCGFCGSNGHSTANCFDKR